MDARRPQPEGVKRRSDDLADRYPLVNDWFEAAVLFVVGCGIFGAVIALWHIAQHAKTA